MKEPPHSSLALRISSAAAFAALVSVQIVACSDDSPSSNGPDAGAGGDEGTGGTGSGGRAMGGSGGGTAGSGAKAGAGGGSSGGASAGGGGGGGMDAGAGTGGGAPEAGVPDASIPEPDAAPDAPAGPPPCAGPTDSSKASLCLDFDPDIVKPIPSEPTLDGQGTLFIDIFDHQPADSNEAPQWSVVYPPGKVDGGSGHEETSVYSLPEIPVDDLPETVYVRTFFFDNSLYVLANARALAVHGAFVGGLDLTQGIVDLQTGENLQVAVRSITLKKGEGTRVKQHLNAMRRFTTKVSLDVTSYADDAQGQISVGVFDVAAPAGAPVLGGQRSFVCVKLADTGVSPYAMTGFFWATGCTPSSPCERWLGGQLDDFNRGGLSKPGSIVSLGGGTTGQQIPAAQKFTVTDDYSVDIPTLSLNTVLPGSTGFTPYPCP